MTDSILLKENEVVKFRLVCSFCGEGNLPHLECPEKINQQTPSPKETEPKEEKSWEERFKDEFDGIYYGKDEGAPIYPPEGFVDDIKSFIETELAKAREDCNKKWAELMKRVLEDIKNNLN